MRCDNRIHQENVVKPSKYEVVNSSLSPKFYFFALIFAVICFQQCNSQKIKSNVITFKNNDPILHKWEQVFSKSEVIPLRFNDNTMEIFRLGSMVMNSRNEIFILDGKNKNGILYFDSTGKFIKYIGHSGEGPGEYLLATALFMDRDDNFYIQDIAKSSILKFGNQGYLFEKMFRIKNPGNKILIDSSGNMFFYQLNSDSGYLFFKYAPDGKLIKSAIKPENQNQRLFISRFNLGGIVDTHEDGILGLFPAEYKIYVFDYKLNVKKILAANSSTYFQPQMDSFPNDLSPYGFSREHSKWWGKQLRPASIYYLGNKLFMVVLAKFVNMSVTFYVNIHDLDGNTYAEGLSIPYNGIIKYAQNGYIYILEDSGINEKGEITPLKLHRFKILIKK